MKINSVCIFTLGCRLNQVESEGIISSFAQKGIREEQNADLYIVNTCTVTSKADQKARRIIRHFCSKGLCIVTGCYASTDAVSIESLGKNIIALGSDDKGKLIHLPQFISDNPDCSEQDIRDFLHNGEENVKFDFVPSFFSRHSRSYLKIQDGCNRNCSFCKVSIARGNPESLTPDEIIKRIVDIQKQGYKEIILTGVNLALYNYDGVRLSALVDMISSVIEKDVHIRFSSMEPDLIDEKLIESIRYDFINPYFHLPLQSASDKVISLTGRQYDRNDLCRIISGLRRVKVNPFIAADIIAGLPGEDEIAFRETYDFIEEVKLSALHVFPFSPRKGTRAAEMKAPEQRIRDERAQALRDLSLRLNREYSQEFVNSTVSAIAEKSNGDKRFFTSDNYLKIVCSNSVEISDGSRYSVHITGLDNNGELAGVIIC